MVFLRKVFPWNEFERLYLVLLIIILKEWVHFFIRDFWKSFRDFFSDFIVAAERFYKGFLRGFSSKRFQSLGTESIIILYIYYGWQ